MKILNIFTAAIGLIILSSCQNRFSDQVSDQLERLDQVLENSGKYENFKQSRIKAIKSRLNVQTELEERYWTYKELWNEYNRYDLDSTVHLVTYKMTLAEKSSDEYLILDSKLDATDTYVSSGMYHEAFELSEMLDTAVLRTYSLMPRYYHVMNNLYSGLALASEDVVMRNIYMKKREEYRSRLHDFIGDDDIARLFVKTEMMLDEGRYAEAIRELEGRLEAGKTTTHENAIIHYMMGLAYRKSGDMDSTLLHYSKSAIYDMETPVRDYKSLYSLAELLYEKGDYERAYRYITRSINDAYTANIRINIESINSLFPIIYDSYNRSMEAKSRILHGLLGGISVLLVLLAIVTALVIKDRKSLASTNRRLNRYISRLKESNEIKETYISRYIDLCSDYIGRLDKYRSELRKIAKNDGVEALTRELRSTEVIEKELQEFYAQFDATFLDLFPDFITQLNNLLQEDKKIYPKGKDGLLSTELRVCALIRLGVTDSVKISEFLRRSVSTIYNYRVKMRNAAVDSREDFEQRIMKIGKQF